MFIRVAGLVPESFVDGDGIRFAIFFQGCIHKCEGCHNPETHDLNGGFMLDTNFIIANIKKNPLLNGITLTGGEPLLQIAPAIEIARETQLLGLNVWCYTGFDYENLPHNADSLLNFVDVLIDGKFIESQRDLELQFRGSRNQRIIDVKKSRLNRKITLWSQFGG